MNDDPTVFVVDDDEAIRKSLRWLIESVDLKVQTFESAQDFLEAYDPDIPGCLVLDVRMKGMSGLDLQERLTQRDIRIPVIILTGHGDVPMAVRAMKSGAVDFLQKPVSDQILLDHIQHALQQDSRGRESRAEDMVIQKRVEQLTKREKQVMQHVVNGMSSKEIASELGVSFKTIEAHRAKIMKKMKAKSVPHLIRMSLSQYDDRPAWPLNAR